MIVAFLVVLAVGVVAFYAFRGLDLLPGAIVTINGCTIKVDAQCPGANLINTIIIGTTFNRTDLRNANLAGASGGAGYAQTDVAKQCNTVLPSGEVKTILKDC